MYADRYTPRGTQVALARFVFFCWFAAPLLVHEIYI